MSGSTMTSIVSRKKGQLDWFQFICPNLDTSMEDANYGVRVLREPALVAATPMMAAARPN